MELPSEAAEAESTQTLAQQGLTPAEGFEVWEMTTNAVVYLETLGHNRFGQPMAKGMKIGPNWLGREFQIRKTDREENQRAVVSRDFDPFRNGTFVRKDAPQDADPNTVSPDAVSSEDLFDICELGQDEFERHVPGMSELPLRRLYDMALQMNVAHRKITFLEDLLRERFTKGAPQKSLSGDGERLSV